MTDASQDKPRRRWFWLRPDHFVLGLLAVELLLLLSAWFQWFAFNRHKGWTAMITVEVVGATGLLMVLWFSVSLVFRWRFQFSLRSLLLLTVVVATACSWLAVERQEARKQREVVAEIAKMNGAVSYDCYFDRPGSFPPGPVWLRKLMGDDLFVNGTAVNFVTAEESKHALHAAKFDPEASEISDAGLAHLNGLPQLEGLSLGYSKVGDAGLEHLKGLTKLRYLNLWGTKVSDAGLAHLEGLAQLQWLWLDRTQVGDAGLEHLKRLTQLQRLGLSDTKISDAGLKYLEGLTQLQDLGLFGTKVSDAGLEHLKGLTQLQELNLNSTQVGDAGLEYLKGLTQLRDLYLGGTKVSDTGLKHLKGLTQLRSMDVTFTMVSDAGVRDLQKALPKARIRGR